MRVRVIDFKGSSYDDFTLSRKEVIGHLGDFFPLNEDMTNCAKTGRWTCGTIFFLEGTIRNWGMYLHRLRVQEVILDTLLGEYEK